MRNHSPRIFYKTLLSIAITGILASCGGSSSSGGGAATFDATLDGVASKGIIINGLVSADELNADKSVKHANVGSATTDSDGKYSLSLNSSYTGGPLKITVTSGANTTMVCDAVSGCGTRTDGLTDPNTNTIIDFGEQYKPASLSMSALLPSVTDGAAVSVQITPFTNMAAERALTNPSLDASAINNANSEVSNLLGGINILSTPPVDITNPSSLGAASANAQVYAALMASVAELAPDDSNGQPDIEQALTTLSDDFSDGTMTASDAADSASVISLDEIVTQANAALQTVNATDTSGVLNELETEVATAAANGDDSVDPQPSPNAGDSNVEKARAFVRDLRTWGVTIGGQIDAPSQAFDTQIEMAGKAADMIQNDGAGDAVALGAMALAEYAQGSLTVLTSYSDAFGASPFSAGTLAQQASSSGVEYSISNAQVSVNGETVDLNMTLTLPADMSSTSELTFGVKNIHSEGASSNLLVNSGAIVVTLSAPYTIDFAGLNAGTASAPADPTKVMFDFDFALTQKKTLAADGVTLVAASDPVTFAGSMMATLFPYSDTTGEIIDAVPGSFSASGTVSNTTGDSYDISLSASIPNASSIQPVNTPLSSGSTYADNNSGAHLVYWQYADSNTFDYHSPDYSYHAVFTAGAANNGTVAIDETFSYGMTQHSDITTNTAVLSNYISNYFRPNNFTYSYGVSGQGNYVRSAGLEDYSSDGFITFTLQDPEVVFFDTTQPLMGKLGVQFSAQFNGLPKALIDVTANATGFEQGDATIKISFDGRSLTFVADNNTSAGAQGSVTVTNQAGVSLSISGTEASETLSVKVDGVEIATVHDLPNGTTRVDYIDGTFEIF